jgi:signal transduction histidine kinase
VGGIVLVLAVLVLLYRSAAARTRMHAAITAKNEELSAANGALQKSIVEREALVHMIIHDLKSPLHQTEALIQAMGELDGMPAMGLKMMDKVKVTNGRGIALIADLLALYQIQNQEQASTESVDAAQLVTEIVAAMEGYAQQKGITLQLQLPDKLPTIRSNPSMLTRVLENLISNALKFSKRSTTVRVLASLEQGELVFSVADEGPGISQEDQAHLFEKFRKLSARPTGGEHSNGLGLAIVKKLAEQLRGRVGVQSELGKGARFWVALPV